MRRNRRISPLDNEQVDVTDLFKINFNQFGINQNKSFYSHSFVLFSIFLVSVNVAGRHIKFQGRNVLLSSSEYVVDKGP